jgi:pentatricopeptide repeat protein
VGAAAAAALVDDMRADGLNPDVPVASALICAYGVLGQFTNAERMLHAVEAVTAAAYNAAPGAEAVRGGYRSGGDGGGGWGGGRGEGGGGGERVDEDGGGWAAAAVETSRGEHSQQPVADDTTGSSASFRQVLQQQEWRLRAGGEGGSGGSMDGYRARPVAPPRPDPKLYTEYLIAACRCGRPEAAIEVFESHNFPRTSYTCTAAIKAYGECQQWEKAEELYQLMARSSARNVAAMAPSGITHSALLSAYEKCGQWQRAVMFLTQIRAAEDEAAAAEAMAATAAAIRAANAAGEEKAGGRGASPSFPFFHSRSVASSVGKKGGRNGLEPKRAKGRVKVQEIHYNIAMSACGKCGEWARAEIIFNEMNKYGVPPSAVSYSTLIAAYGAAGEEERANKRFKEMVDVSPPLVPDDYTFVGLMLAPAGRGDIPMCLEIKRQMPAYGVKPTVHVYNELMRAADVAARYELAVEFYQQMIVRGITPNVTTEELLRGVGRKGVDFYEDQQLAASFGTLVAGLIAMAGMVSGNW